MWLRMPCVPGEHRVVVGHRHAAAGRRSSPTPPTRPSAGVRAISSSRVRRCSCAANSSGPYSTKVPSSSRSARFSRAVRRPRSWRRATASRARRVEADRVALAHRRAGPRARRRSARLGARRARRLAPPRRRLSVSSSWPSSTASPTATASSPTTPADLGEHLVLHLHRLEHDQRRAGADVLVGRVRDRDDDAGERGGHGELGGRGHRRDHRSRAARARRRGARRTSRASNYASARCPSRRASARPPSGARRSRSVLAQARGCARCAELAATRKTVVFGAGNADAELMFVGEAPGASEDEQGLPFVGRAGKLLEKLLGEIGLQRAEVFIANIAQVPASRQPRPAAGRDRELPGVPAAPGRADPADGDLHARQLLDQAAARRPDRDHAPARPARGARARRARGAAVPDLPPGRRAVHAAHARDAARGLRAAAGAARAGRARAAAAPRRRSRRAARAASRRPSRPTRAAGRSRERAAADQLGLF